MSGNKYSRVVRGVGGQVSIDVYDVLVAFGVTCPARAHAIKKILAAGQRGAKSELQDLREARQSLARACELLPLSEEDRAVLEIERILETPEAVEAMGGLMNCELCGAAAAAEHRCDACGRNYCDDCAPHREDDIPVDSCVACWKMIGGPRTEEKTVDEPPPIGDTAPQ